MALGDLLPQVYSQVLSKDLLSLNINESAIRCEPCLMSEGPDGYLNSVKCCSYFPFVPNFLVGAMLSEGTSDFVKLTLQELAKAGLVSPLGLMPPPSYRTNQSTNHRERFGRDESLLCPFFSAGNCSIWRHRPSVCATYHCRSSYGADGIKFWSQLADHLHQVDWSLAQWCMVHGGFSSREIEAAVGAFEKSPGPGLSLWPSYWRGRELEFFISCTLWATGQGKAWLVESRIDEPQLG